MTFATLYQELTHSTEMIRALTMGIGQEQAQVKPDAKAWSMLEVICHLYDEETEDFRERVDFILHRQHEAWKVIDPQGWVTTRRYNEQDFAQMRERFFARREDSLQWLAGLKDAAWDTTYTSEYGTTSAGEMLACWAAHDNLHIRQLVELRRAYLERAAQPHNLEYAGDW